ncbi:MAG: hypothetical protein AMJ75_00680 [Phycisphaerae bacterium SM1_79]|nr:MAG: hypothetical protein AMJ75_00680 [Phycisphaerae bacterium SM1_79]
MKKFLMILIMLCLLLCGCDSLRFAPGEAQKQNAWLHSRTAAIAAETARSEAASQKLQALTKLSQLQSRAFTSYYGLPIEVPPADTAEDVLRQSNWQIANTALSESVERPDAWKVADNALELGIGICALLGGVYGTRAVHFLKQARTKSKALQEIIAGNELFKKQNESSIAAFKQAQKLQSPQTRQIVAEVKA